MAAHECETPIEICNCCRETIPQPPKREFGHFEAHTRGIGGKLLQQMGYEKGQGLGKQAGKGLVNPIEVSVRPKGLGLGMGSEGLGADQCVLQGISPGECEK